MRLARLAAPATLTLALLAAPLAVGAQSAEKLPRIAVVFTDSLVTTMLGSDPAHPNVRAFLQGLRALGYVEGQNVLIDRRSAEGRFDRYPQIFAECIQAKVDVIVAANVPVARAAQQTTKTIPIVLASGADPAAAGLVGSLARPGGNITGVTADVGGVPFFGKVLELLKEAVPKASRLAVIGDTPSPGSAPSESIMLGGAQEFRSVADALRLTPFPLAVDSPEELAPAFATFTRQQADSLLVRATAFTYAHRKRIADLATQHRLPSICSMPEVAEAGGLMAYGPSVADLYRRAAGYVDKILKGAKPADLPIERPAKFDLVINLKTAKALGLTIPPSVLARADEVIQ